MYERRLRRSQDPYSALCLQLESSRVKGELDAVVVAIHNGLLVAGAGERSICEALGAVAPLVGSPSFNGRLPSALEGQSVEVHAMTFEGETVYVATVGRGGGDEWLQQSIGGVRRILSSSWQADPQLLIN
jgi:hypothetical protein